MRRFCEHKRIKKNYYFGRMSKPRMTCKDCGKIIKPKEISSNKKIDKRKGKNDRRI